MRTPTGHAGSSPSLSILQSPTPLEKLVTFLHRFVTVLDNKVIPVGQNLVCFLDLSHESDDLSHKLLLYMLVYCNTMSDTSTLFTLLTHRLRRRLLVQLCAAKTLRVPDDLRTRRAPVPGTPTDRPGSRESGSVLDSGNQPDLSRSDDELLVELQHVHLPKLESAGVIDWGGGERVERGPKFEEYEPALRTMIDAADTFPDPFV